MKKNIFKAIFLTIVLLSFAACTPFTNSLYEQKNYREDIKGFLLLKEGKQLLAVSNKYNYIFDISSELKNILSSRYRKDLEIEAQFSSFKITNHINIEGKYTITYKTSDHLPKEIENWFFETGFVKKIVTNVVKGAKQKELIFVKKEKLYGKRYLPDAKLSKFVKEKFNKEYKSIYIYYDGEYINDEDTRKFLTPITVALDVSLITAFVVSSVVVFAPMTPALLIVGSLEKEPYPINGSQTKSLYEKYKVSSKYELRDRKSNILLSQSSDEEKPNIKIESKKTNTNLEERLYSKKAEEKEIEHFFIRAGLGHLDISQGGISDISMHLGINLFPRGLVKDGFGLGLTWDGTNQDIENSENMTFTDIYGLELMYNYHLKNNYTVINSLFFGKISEELVDGSYNKIKSEKNSVNGVAFYMNFPSIIKTGDGPSLFYKYLYVNETGQSINMAGFEYIW